MNDTDQAISIIRTRAGNVSPKIALILGTGLGDAINGWQTLAAIPYGVLPGFQPSGVESHKGQLSICRVGETQIAVMQGRFHLYEGHQASAMLGPMRVLQALGCETLIITNAANALYEEHKPPGLMLITDHINAMGDNPLIGKEGNRFIDMNDAYDPALRERLLACAKSAGVTLHQGVYYAMLGPAFETRAEARMARQFGAHAVGMSTVPEVIAARSLGMRVAGISALTNRAADSTGKPHTLEDVIEGARSVAGDLGKLMAALLR
ncbi:MAG: purine-nucleoside phosphorylase [Planctomycetes bacterium]|nr:purine-nucleoside phosphorylase [Planctomycetota bacterium]